MPRGNNNKKRDQQHDMLMRLEIVAELWRKNYTLEEIRKEVMRRLDRQTLSIRTVHMDVKRLLKEWQKERLQNTEEKITAELARLDLVIKEAWRMWEKSKKDYNSKTYGQQGVPTGKDEDGKVTVETIKSMMWDAEHRGCGNPKYLDVILKALDQRCKLLGLNKETVELGAASNGAIEIRYVDAGIPCATSEEEVRTREGLTY